LRGELARPRVYDGGCLCGAIRFQATGPAGWPHTRSCRMCQRHSGSLTLARVEFPREAVRWTGPGGEPARWRSWAMSGRAFCPICGSTSGALDDAATVALVLGSFDAPNRVELAPVSHCHVTPRPK